MSEEMQHQWAEKIVRVLNTVFPDGELANWQRCQRYILHVQTIHTAIEQWKIETEETAHLLLKSGWYLCLQASYDAAEQYCQQAVAIFEKLAETNGSWFVNALDTLAPRFFILILGNMRKLNLSVLGQSPSAKELPGTRTAKWLPC